MDTPGEADMFVMPAACAAFGNVIPPLGTRISFEVVPDEKTGKPRANNVVPDPSSPAAPEAAGAVDPLEEAAQKVLQSYHEQQHQQQLEHLQRLQQHEQQHQQQHQYHQHQQQQQLQQQQLQQQQQLLLQQQLQQQLQGGSQAYSDQLLTGTVRKDNGKFGFIAVDGQEGVDMFVMPAACAALGGAIPPLGTRVRFSVVTDGKTGRPRADSVTLAADDGLSPEAALMAEAEMAFQAMADAAGLVGAGGIVQPLELQPGVITGTVKRSEAGFGFISSDAGGPDIFALPSGCAAFGNVIPPTGTRVCFDFTTDEKKGLPLASNVAPLEMMNLPVAQSATQPIMLPSGTHVGTIRKDNGKFGFIQHDGDDMFVMPAACAAFGGLIPPIGTPVTFDVVIDSKTGRPRAENVLPATSAMTAGMEQVLPTLEKSDPMSALAAYVGEPNGYAGKGDMFTEFFAEMQRQTSASLAPSSADGPDEGSGTVKRLNGNFGFIQQDTGGEDMFFMPLACAAFGNVMPPAGTRVLYSVVSDSKTGRPRAENVRAEAGRPDGSYGAQRQEYASYQRGRPY